MRNVRDLFESENQNNATPHGVRSLNVQEENFIVRLMEYTEEIWPHSNTTVKEFQKKLGYGKSKLYRTMMSILGKSPNVFLKEYRLNEALKFFDKQNLNISEIAYKTGFSSPAYFSKCFQEKYGMLPSKYVKQIAYFNERNLFDNLNQP